MWVSGQIWAFAETRPRENDSGFLRLEVGRLNRRTFDQGRSRQVTVNCYEMPAGRQPRPCRPRPRGPRLRAWIIGSWPPNQIYSHSRPKSLNACINGRPPSVWCWGRGMGFKSCASRQVALSNMRTNVSALPPLSHVARAIHSHIPQLCQLRRTEERSGIRRSSSFRQEGGACQMGSSARTEGVKFEIFSVPPVKPYSDDCVKSPSVIHRIATLSIPMLPRKREGVTA
jgi:hypothetical protein